MSIQRQNQTDYFANSYLKVPFSQDYDPTNTYLIGVAQWTLSPQSPYNPTFFDDPEYQGLYGQATATADESTQRDLIRQMATIDQERGGNVIPYFFPHHRRPLRDPPGRRGVRHGPEPGRVLLQEVLVQRVTAVTDAPAGPDGSAPAAAAKRAAPAAGRAQAAPGARRAVRRRDRHRRVLRHPRAARGRGHGHPGQPGHAGARGPPLRAELGLDQPALVSYARWVGGLVTGDFGTSLASRAPVWDVVEPRLANSVVLVLLASVCSTVLGIALGAYAAARRDRALDHTTSVLSLVASSLPEFTVGVFVVLALAFALPTGLPSLSILPPGTPILGDPVKLVLPLITLVIVTTPYVFRMTRAATIDALISDYAEVARLKGVSERRLIFRHALPNAWGRSSRSSA